MADPITENPGSAAPGSADPGSTAPGSAGARSGGSGSGDGRSGGPAVPPPSPINTLGASAAVAALGVVVVVWAWSARSAAGIVAGSGILVLAAAGVGAGVGVPRRRTARGAGVGLAVGLLVAVAVIGSLVAAGRSADVGGDPAVAIDRPFAGTRYAWALDDGTVVAVTDDTLLTIADDGTTTEGPDRAAGTPVLVPHGGDAVGGVATGGLDDEVELRSATGELVWQTALSIDDQPATNIDVAAADAEGRVAVQACNDGGCALVGLDAEGRELWRRAGEEVDLGLGRVVVDVPSDPDLRAAPPRLVVVGVEDGGPAIELDLATGEETELGAGGVVAVVDDVVTIFRLEGDRCEVGILRGADDEEATEVPCRGGALVRPTPTGSVVVQRQWDGAVAVDTASGDVGSMAVGGGETMVTGAGLLVEKTQTSTRVQRVVDGEVLATHEGWNVVVAGPDGVVLDRDRESANPFAPERLREVAILDPDTGEVCARLRLDVTYVSRASALPGCRALVDPSEGPDLLVG